MKRKEIFKAALNAIKDEKNLVKYMVFYSLLEGILMLSLPLTSSLIINNIIAHATFSVITLSIIIFVLFLVMMGVKTIQEYIIEKFKQQIFVEKSIDLAEKYIRCNALSENKEVFYFYEVMIIQKLFPKFVLNSIAIFLDIIIGLILLFVFSIFLFEMGLVLVIYFAILILLGYNGVKYAMLHSDLKYETFFFLKDAGRGKIVGNILSKLDILLNNYLDVRHRFFKVLIRQKIFSFFIQAVIYGLFFLVGGFLVINGKIPIGEFVAAEIVIVYINYAIKGLIKEIDTFYDIAEGFYKFGKLEHFIESKEK
jgi:ABC-type bacteriocin/lantibiotic exporter with double-glycine peptidase domain